MPNLALMKISMWHKRLGDSVTLVKMENSVDPPLELFDSDVIYASCIFTWSRKKVKLLEDFAKWRASKSPIGLAKVLVGGSGYDLTNKLADTIEHLMPDYSLYGIDYSIGFTSRGCIRNCPWCLVPKKEGSMQDYSPINEFLHPKHKKLILLDNNFLASPKWKDNLLYIIQHRLTVNFCQGLDIRLVNYDNTNLLAHVDFMNWTFKNKQLHFAFDVPNMEKAVRKGVEILKYHGIPPRKLMFYMLVGFNTIEETWFEEDMHRFNILRELGVDPFVMIYNNRKDVPILRYFARWVNKRIYKSCRWKDYEPIKKLSSVINV